MSFVGKQDLLLMFLSMHIFVKRNHIITFKKAQIMILCSMTTPSSS